MANKVPVTNQDREKSYFKYYAVDVYYGEHEKYDMISKEPEDNSKALHIKDRNDLFLLSTKKRKITGQNKILSIFFLNNDERCPLNLLM